MIREERLAVGALAILGMHNLVQNYWLNERGYVAGNLAVTGLLVAMGRRAGVSWEEMGLDPGRAGDGLKLGGVVGAAAGAGIFLSSGHHRARLLFLDERALNRSRDEVWRRALVRFPLGTALFEEVAFRGVLPALLRRARWSRSAEWISATAFGLWHVIATHRALQGNVTGQSLSPMKRRVAAVLGSAVAGLAGLGFAWMRSRTRSVTAPWLAHAAFNTFSFLGARTALSSLNGRPRRTPPPPGRHGATRRCRSTRPWRAWRRAAPDRM